MPEQNPNSDSQVDSKSGSQDESKSDSIEVPDDSSSSSEDEPMPEEERSSESGSDSDSEHDSDDSDYEPAEYIRPEDPQVDTDDEENNTPEANIQRFMRILNSKRMKKAEEEEDEEVEYHEDLFDFPEDKENWKEEDLRELWADAPLGMTKPGWDPNWVDDDEIEIINDMISKGEDPPIQPFYVPYRKYYPAIPDNHYDIATAKATIEELDRIEEFLTWVSYIFEDGSSYEGTIWDDLAHGKGVYIADQGLIRYEGEWLQNQMEGHGILEVDIPTDQPVPGSKLEAKMRAEGKIIKRDFMDPDDRKWLEMDIEDTVRYFDGEREIPFYENEEWITYFGAKPEKGRYRYAGQWKHGRFHGCGVYEVNERVLYGRFYFGQFLEEDKYGCDADITSVHRGIAEVAAAKARMFMYKPDGMVREQWGPYDDPQHPYFYEEDEVWMAPGFINQFYEVPDYWKNYVHQIDEEIQVWLNSFYHAPLRLPMPAELSYWWENEKEPEFVLVGDEPVPDPEDPSKLVYTDDPLIVHTPTGRIINYVDDEEHGVRLFWQPDLKEGEELDLEKVDFLPLGFDEFYGRVKTEKKPHFFIKLLTGIDNWFKPHFEKLEKWAMEKKADTDAKFELLKAEIDLLDAELSLKETIDEMDKELEIMQKEEEKKAEMGIADKDDILTESDQLEKSDANVAENEDDEEEEEEEEEEEAKSSSFGSVKDRETSNNEKGKPNGKAPFAASSFSFAASAIPSMVQQSFSKWKEGKHENQTSQQPSFLPINNFTRRPVDDHASSSSSSSVSFPHTLKNGLRLKARGQKRHNVVSITTFHPKKCSNRKNFIQMQTMSDECSFNVLSWHTPILIP